MSGLGFVVTVGWIAASAPIPPDPKPVVKCVEFEPAMGWSLGDPVKPLEDFNSRKPADPELKAYYSLDDLSQKFADPEKLTKALGGTFDPKRHTLLFARWYSWSFREKVSTIVNDRGAVVVVHHRHGLSRGEWHNVTTKSEYNVVLIIVKDTRWSQGTVFPDEKAPGER